MNAKHLLAALSLALAGTGAMAFEATQFDDPVSTLSRAEVRAEQRDAQPLQLSGGEATQFDDRAAAPVSREEIRAQAREGLVFSELYVA